MRLMKTLRARLSIGTALGAGLVLSASALVLYMVVRGRVDLGDCSPRPPTDPDVRD
jgi:hypothetical protein